MENYNPEPQYFELKASVAPSLISIMMSLQADYNLPIEIVCGDMEDDLRPVTLRIAGFEESTLHWFINTAVCLEVLRSGNSIVDIEDFEEVC